MISGITFLGVRTARLAEMKKFCQEVLGLPIKHEEPEFVAFHAPNGDRIELFGMDDPEHELFNTGPVVGFDVPDIVEAHQHLQASGVELLSKICGNPQGRRWLHFRAPDGNVYEVTQCYRTS